MDTDVLIVGAGPAGLSLALALSHAGLHATVLEQQSLPALAQPAPDGREIALTQPSVQTLQRLGTWQRLLAHEQGFIRQAIVHDGPVGTRPTLTIDTVGQDMHELGRIVPNCALRRTAFEAAQTHDNIRLITGATVTQVVRHAQCAQVHYQVHEGGVRVDAPPLSAPLVVAADSRFSAVRRMLGVAAQMTDFGRGVIVCRMRHTLEHHDVAHECFGYERTLAILPLQPDPATGDLLCSAVVTSDSPDIARLMQLDEQDFSAQVQAHFQHRLGEMELVGPRHHYPLVATYARQFSGPCFALLGDAAVGMLPVTAHGFNLGLSGVERLSSAVASAYHAGQDWGHESVLAAYSRSQHRHAWPLFQGTNAVVKLFTDARPAPKLLRQIVLQGAQHLPPLKAAIVAQLSGRSPWGILREQLPRPPFARQG